MIIDFWTTNLNPITLLPTVLENKYEKPAALKKQTEYRVRVSVDLAEDSNYISSKEAINTLGIGAKIIKKSILNNGLEFQIFISRNISYYKRCDVEGIEIVIASKFTIPEDYISGVELRKLNDWTSWDLWNQANKNKWKKKKFSGNTTYFLKSEVLKLK